MPPLLTRMIDNKQQEVRMDNSIHEQGSDTQQGPKSLLVSPPILGNLIKWLASLIQWTEEEQEEAGIYMDHPGGD